MLAPSLNPALTALVDQTKEARKATRDMNQLHCVEPKTALTHMSKSKAEFVNLLQSVTKWTKLS